MQSIQSSTPSGFSGNKPLSEEEIKRMMLCALPRTFQVQVAKSAKTLGQFSVKELLEFLKTCLEDSKKPLKKVTTKVKIVKKIILI